MSNLAEENDRLTRALRECDLATVAEIAKIKPEHTSGDRLALLQSLFPRVAEPEMRDRLEDFANVITSHPQLCNGVRELLANIRKSIEREFGPYAFEYLPPEDILIAFLKEPSPLEKTAHEFGLRPDHLFTFLAHALPRGWDTPVLPPTDYFLAFWQKLTDHFLQEFQVIVNGRMVGQRTQYGGIHDCPHCHGNGLIHCPTCGGSGAKDEKAIGEAITSADFRRRLEIQAATRGNQISHDALRRILGAEAIDCPDCGGKGHELCECCVWIDVPAGARTGWICPLTRADGTVVAYRQIRELKS